MKKTILSAGILLFSVMVFDSSAKDSGDATEHRMHHDKMHSINDERISLGLPSAMKQHQLENMRAHLEAIRSILGFISDGSFDKASQLAHTKLGLTEEMKKMCDMFENEEFKSLGLAFHKSGDTLGEALKTKDITKSLDALHTTMGYCVQCHATYRQ